MTPPTTINELYDQTTEHAIDHAVLAAPIDSPFEAYLARSNVAKLHIGCGKHLLPGWLNSDFTPQLPEVARLDATAIFPIRAAAFDYIFSEHMIEHVPFEGGQNMLNESYRVLKSGGRIRISTPDLKFLIDLYAPQKTALQQAYIDWATRRFVPSGIASDTFVINNFMRNWGHLFIYDTKTLRHALAAAGFVDISAHSVNHSAVPDFMQLEHDGRMPPGFLQLETMTMEARKP